VFDIQSLFFNILNFSLLTPIPALPRGKELLL
jgi:hypothetical protein